MTTLADKTHYSVCLGAVALRQTDYRQTDLNLLLVFCGSFFVRNDIIFVNLHRIMLLQATV